MAIDASDLFLKHAEPELQLRGKLVARILKRGFVVLTSSENDPTSNGYASGLASVSYQYSADGTTWATIGTLSSAPFDTILWNTTGVADGVYQVRIVAHDAAGNAAPSASVTNVRIDNTPPASRLPRR